MKAVPCGHPGRPRSGTRQARQNQAAANKKYKESLCFLIPRSAPSHAIFIFGVLRCDPLPIHRITPDRPASQPGRACPRQLAKHFADLPTDCRRVAPSPIFRMPGPLLAQSAWRGGRLDSSIVIVHLEPFR
ncbi:hypothetical protein [Burkholderia glumae]|uniref:hypothetical protein n=1 Tax=Burkholderia glumae TaxID=337 RepID=UPI002164AA72|nr:hypothetical protein [Burkholderia glumae]